MRVDTLLKSPLNTSQAVFTKMQSEGDNGDMYCALFAGMPYISPFGTGVSKIGTDNRTTDTELLDDENLQKEIARVTPLADLQAKLYNKEMVKHEFLGSIRRQRATYADGTTVTIDLDKNTYEIGE